MSSLVMSEDNGEELATQSAAGVITAAHSARSTSATEAAATERTSVSSALSANDMSDLFSLPPFPPPPEMGSSDGLLREQSFPPPNCLPPRSSPCLNRDQSFPPPVQPAFSAIDALPLSSVRNDWCMNSITTIAESSGVSFAGGGSGSGGSSDDGSGGGSISGGDLRRPSEFDGPRVERPPIKCESNLDKKQWNVERRGSNGGIDLGVSSSSTREAGRGGNGNDDSFFGDNSSSSSAYADNQHDSRPRYDKLAAMIPGVNPWQTPSPSPPSVRHTNIGSRGNNGGMVSTNNSNSNKRLRTAGTPVSSPTGELSRGRQVVRSEKARKKRVDAPGRGSGRGRGHMSKRLVATAAGAEGEEGLSSLHGPPANADGGGVHPAKRDRRKAAIKRYMYKRSRRRFANSTRDASPSRSRPKAAKIRPRHLGKFVRTVPEFIPVTHPAMIAQGGAAKVSGKRGKTAGAAGSAGSDHKARARGGNSRTAARDVFAFTTGPSRTTSAQGSRQDAGSSFAVSRTDPDNDGHDDDDEFWPSSPM